LGAKGVKLGREGTQGVAMAVVVALYI